MGPKGEKVSVCCYGACCGFEEPRSRGWCSVFSLSVEWMASLMNGGFSFNFECKTMNWLEAVIQNLVFLCLFSVLKYILCLLVPVTYVWGMFWESVSGAKVSNLTDPEAFELPVPLGWCEEQSSPMQCALYGTDQALELACILCFQMCKDLFHNDA